MKSNDIQKLNIKIKKDKQIRFEHWQNSSS